MSVSSYHVVCTNMQFVFVTSSRPNVLVGFVESGRLLVCSRVLIDSLKLFIVLWLAAQWFLARCAGDFVDGSLQLRDSRSFQCSVHNSCLLCRRRYWLFLHFWNCSPALWRTVQWFIACSAGDAVDSSLQLRGGWSFRRTVHRFLPAVQATL